jgi:hypothetical protein
MPESNQPPPTAASLRGVLNLREVEPGVTIQLKDGATAEVIDNPRDGMWLICRYLATPDDPAKTGTVEEIFVQDVAGVVG